LYGKIVRLATSATYAFFSEGLTIGGRTSDWKKELGRFLKPFSGLAGPQGAATDVCALRVGLNGPGDRKSIAPMSERLALGEYDQLHYFIAAGVWRQN
jgi:hypothetical protein